MGLTSPSLPSSFTYKIGSKDNYIDGLTWMTTFTLVQDDQSPLAVSLQTPVFIQTEECTAGGVAIDPYGAITIASSVSNDVTITITAELNGTVYSTESPVALATAKPGDTITLVAAA